MKATSYGIWVESSIDGNTPSWLTEHDPFVSGHYAPIPMVRASKPEMEKMAEEYRKTFHRHFTYTVKEYTDKQHWLEHRPGGKHEK